MKYILKYKDKETTISVDQFNEIMSDIDDNDIDGVYVKDDKTIVETFAGIVYYNNLSNEEKKLTKKLVKLYKKVSKEYGLSYDDVWEYLLADELEGDE